MEPACPVAASAFEPGEEPVQSFFSLKAFSTVSYRDAPEPPAASSPASASSASPPASSSSSDCGERDGRKFPSSLTDLFSLELPSRSTTFLAPALSSLGLLRSPTSAERREEEMKRQENACEAEQDSGGSPCTQAHATSALPESFSLCSTLASDVPALLGGSPNSPSLPSLPCAETKEEASLVPPVCLVVCVHGIGGVSSDFQFTQTVLQQRAPHIRVLVSTSNTGKTFDGVQRGGERLAEEVRQEVARFPSLAYISLIGFSLGGLYMRFAVRLLYTPASGSSPATVCGLRPLCVGTVASPHLGVRRFSYLPLPEGLMKPLLSSYFLITSHLRARQGSASSSPGASSARGGTGEETGPVGLQGLEAPVEPEGEKEGVSAEEGGEALCGVAEETGVSGETEDVEEQGAEQGFNLGRLSQLHESRTLADLMLVSEREYLRELKEAEKKVKNEKMLSWLWRRRGSAAEDGDPQATVEGKGEGEAREKSEPEDRDEFVDSEDEEEPLLVQMSQGVFVESLKVFAHRRLYANARGDVLVPLGTAAIDPTLPANTELQKILQCTPRSMIVGSGRVVMISRPEKPPVYVSSTSEETFASSALHNDAPPRPAFLSEQSTHYVSCCGSLEIPVSEASVSPAASLSPPALDPTPESSVSAAPTLGSEAVWSETVEAFEERRDEAGEVESTETDTEEAKTPCSLDLSSEQSSSFSSLTSSSLFPSFSLRRPSSYGSWREWLKLNTHGEIEAAMASRLNEVKWTKVIVDFPTLVPVAHDSINASGKSRFRTWVTAGGRPIVEQLVDWLVSSLDEALAADRLKQAESLQSSRDD
ncbi:serine esterase (DUF676) protein [Toxoplasma gondii ME49]|uniref:Serine esterase (DUF676) protein n=2 Tax=Toxoplasma gondii TaxID=5811 RepID=S8GJ47_TOXGM|nr:serine esterase (DUF676) protein [Toxoplasma gondii ME49]EPT28534.1 serine esterase (DUF676) protein [Toxoplasma gondii ME49]|eukprot:XP_018636665.1 serine esterase (DUF676) protein [Toxoplasma gondii ME49]